MFDRPRHWLWYGGAWALLTLYFTSWDLLTWWPKQGPLHLLAMNATQDLGWCVLGLGLVAIAQRHPIEGLGRAHLRAWAINLAASVALTFFGLLWAWTVSVAFSGDWRRLIAPEILEKSLKYFFRSYFHSLLLVQWGIQGAWHGFRLLQSLRVRDVERAELERSLAQARNQALRSQLQPHFLFNTLNSISALIHSDPEAADRMVARLSDLLRHSLEASGAQEVSLRQELEVVRLYLEVEQVRFHDRLRVSIQAPPETLAARVPSLLLQPLVENALKHGLAGRAQGGAIQVAAARQGDMLVLEVQDDGVGFSPGREGIGLNNTRSRLRLLHGDRQTLEIFSVADKGTRVVVRIPFC